MITEYRNVDASVVFIGGMRYNFPLDTTSDEKFRALSKLGKLFVIGFSGSGRARVFRQHAKFYLLPVFPIPIMRYFILFFAGTAIALWCIFRHNARILVAQSPYEGYSAACVKGIARLFGKRVVLIIENHNDFESSLFLQRRIYIPSVYRFVMRVVARFAFKSADIFRAVSTMTEEQISRWAPGKPIFRFVAWTNMAVFLEAGAQGVKAADELKEILFTGVLIRRKGVHNLIVAFAQIAGAYPHSRLTIIGRPADPVYSSQLKSMVEANGMEGRVCFKSEVSQTDLAVEMRKADIFVLPSISEALGRVVFEAMATGTPVVGSDVGGIPEMVRDGVTGFLVPPGDTDALADRLRWMLDHPYETNRMGLEARRFAESFFSTEAYVEGYRLMFETAHELLSKSE